MYSQLADADQNELDLADCWLDANADRMRISEGPDLYFCWGVPQMCANLGVYSE